MFEDVNEYIKKTREERRAHLKLDDACLEIGGSSRNFRGALALHLKTTVPSGFKILLCHGCHNAKCGNLNHLYWGTSSDNLKDSYICGARTPISLTSEQRSKIGKAGAEGLRKKKEK